MKTIYCPIILLLTLSSGFSEEPQKPIDPNTRPAGVVVLKFERKIEIPEIRRFSEEGVLEIFPGDTVHLEFEEEGGNLVRPRVVTAVADRARTITFKMTQDESITMLYRETGIQNTVALDCRYRQLGSDELGQTNLYPTEKGLVGGDSWSNSVWMLRLSNIEVTSKPAAEVYEEKTSRESESEEKAPQTPQ